MRKRVTIIIAEAKRRQVCMARVLVYEREVIEPNSFKSQASREQSHIMVYGTKNQFVNSMQMKATVPYGAHTALSRYNMIPNTTIRW